MVHLGNLIPVAFFLGVLTTVLKLSETEELVAILASGRGLLWLSRPFVFTGFFFFFFSLLSSNYLESWGKGKLLSFVEEKAVGKIKSVLQQKMQEDVFVEIFRNYYLYASSISEDKTKYKNVILAPKFNREGKNSFFISAKGGESVGDQGERSLVLKFYEGTLYQISSKKEDGIFAMNFDSFDVDFFTGIHSQIGADKNYYDKTKSVPSFAIYKKLRSDSMKDQEEQKILSFLLFSRLFSPFLVLIFCFWGLLLGVYNVRQEKSLVFFYFFLVFLFASGLSRFIEWLCEEGLTRAEVVVPFSYLLFLLVSFFALFLKDRQALWEPFRLIPRERSPLKK